MHRAFGAGSVSPAAAEYGRQHGIAVIDGGCPLMFAPTSDVGHKAMRLVCTLSGSVPRQVGPATGDRRTAARDDRQAGGTQIMGTVDQELGHG
jgi:hypothetical protein